MGQAPTNLWPQRRHGISGTLPIRQPKCFPQRPQTPLIFSNTQVLIQQGSSTKLHSIRGTQRIPKFQSDRELQPKLHGEPSKYPSSNPPGLPSNSHTIFCQSDNRAFKTAVNDNISQDCKNNPSCTIIEVYGYPTGKWCILYIADVSNLFFLKATFNNDISGWNIRKLTNMDYMFYASVGSNQPLENWNTGNVQSMNDMFYLLCQRSTKPWEIGIPAMCNP